MPKSKVEKDFVEKQKIISSLTLMDDLFMKVVLQDIQCTEFILKTIMDIPTLKLKSSKKFIESPWTFFNIRLPLRRWG